MEEKFKCFNKKEQILYDKEGGGEKGEKAVLAYRDYMNLYKDFERQIGREKRRAAYYPNNEKSTATICTYDRKDNLLK